MRFQQPRQDETGLTPGGDLAHQVVANPIACQHWHWWELIALMVSAVTIGETAPGSRRTGLIKSAKGSSMAIVATSEPRPRERALCPCNIPPNRQVTEEKSS
jgi:hypothetical protein